MTRWPSRSTQLDQMPKAVEQALATMEPIRALARELAGAKSVLFIGRHVGYPVALEGALKLKELAYMHAEAFAAGELKHGPIALIEAGAAGRGRRPTARPRRSARQDRQQHPGDPGPREPAPSCWPRRATRQSSGGVTS